jgi:photosystem II stability/assembly factor-like uncharacterized protein
MRRRRTFQVSFIVATITLTIAILSLQACTLAGTATLFVAQEDGHVLVSTDGGANWRSRLTRPDTNLWDISAVAAPPTWAAGQGYTADDGVVFRSVDGGNSWSEVYSSKQQYLRGISATNARSAWAVGGKYSMGLEQRKAVLMVISPDPLIIRTDDGGATWADRTPHKFVAGQISEVSATNARSAWVAPSSFGNGLVWMTDDGGASWADKLSQEGLLIEDISAIDRDTIWVVASDGGIYSLVLKTSDGGKTWSSHRFAKNELVRSIAVVNDNTAWVVGSQGLVFKTTDGGKAWVRQNSGTKRSLRAVSAPNPGNVCAVGAGGAIIITTDGGKTWRKQFSTNKSDLFGVSMVVTE